MGNLGQKNEDLSSIIGGLFGEYSRKDYILEAGSERKNRPPEVITKASYFPLIENIESFIFSFERKLTLEEVYVLGLM